ncbi:translocation/assembly module TamB domain-containing protein [Thiotrichales bacterium 19S3-7]|nr:translocation/assembly module TamB domain-containing protein [Thiotrichales bacterium 19S3-7]MCF6802893.1 translocation/assembly module TamB domain-containing protein [Thiotrichales bacterium 19S3-11]
MKKMIRSCSNILLTFLIGIFIFGIILFYTHSGLKIIVAGANFILNSHGITIQSKDLKGTLSNFYISQINVHVDETNVEIQGANVKWYPQLLITGIFNISSIIADNVKVTVNTDDSDSENSQHTKDDPNNDFNWPIYAKNVQIKKVQVNVDQHTQVNAENFHAKAQLINHKLRITNASFFYEDIPTDAQSLTGTLSLKPPFQFKANLELIPQISNTNLIATAKINAPLKHYFAASISFNGTIFSQELYANAQLKASDKNVTLDINQFNSTIGLGNASFNFTPNNNILKSKLALSLPRYKTPSRLDTVELSMAFDLSHIINYKIDQKQVMSFTDCSLTVNQYRQACQFKLEQNGKSIFLKHFILGDHNQYIKANGKIYPLFDFSWQTNIEDVNRFIPDISGHLTSDGYLYGSFTNPGLSSLTQFTDAKYLHYSLGDYNARISLRNNYLDSSLKIINKPHNIDADIKLKGEKKDNTWFFSLLSSKLNSKELGQWSLYQNQAITLNTNTAYLQVPNICLLSAEQSICSSLILSNYSFKTKIQTHLRPNPYFKLLMPQLETENGIFNARIFYAKVKWFPTWLTINASLDSINLRLGSLSDALIQKEKYTTINFINFLYSQFEDSATVKAQTNINNKSNANLELYLTNVHSLSELDTIELDGKLNTNINDLGFLNYLSKQPINVSGELNSNLSLQGKLSNPDISGSTTVKNASVHFYNYNSQIEKITLNARGENRHWQITANGYNNAQPLNLTADINWNKQLLFTSNLKGSNIQVANIPPLQITISPNLTLTYDKEFKLTGQIAIDQAKIHGDNLPNLSNANQMQADIVYVSNDNQPIAVTTEVPVAMNLQILLGDDTKFYGFGLKSYFAGKIIIQAEPHQNAIAQGKVHLKDAIYTFYGKQFVIQDNSAISFTNSPLDNPYLNITANYQIPTQQQLSLNSPDIIGVHVLGTLKSPIISFFSTPAMSQANILSYIVLGQTLDNSDNFSKEQQQQLSSAALALALNGGSSVILQDVQSKFGITDISFGTIQQGQILTDQLQPTSSAATQTGNQNNTALFIGKALTPHLYINYGVGIFTGEQLVQAIYRLNKNWRLQADYTNLDTGADIIYQFLVD